MPDGGLFITDGGTSIPDGILADKIFALIRPDLVLALQGIIYRTGGLGVPDGGASVPGPFFFSSLPFCWALFSDSLA